MSQTCQRCYKIVHRACQSDAESESCPNLRRAKQEKLITVVYRSCDGYRAVRKYKTLRGARKYAHERVGEHPDFGSTYAVSFDGIGTVSVEGCSLRELFPPPAEPAGPEACGVCGVVPRLEGGHLCGDCGRNI